MAARDLDRMRDILIKLDTGSSVDGKELVVGDSFFRPSDSYQLKLLEQAGLVTIQGRPDCETSLPINATMTFQGHDYLDAIRSVGIWEQTKATIADTGGSATLEVLKSLATGFLKKKIEEHTGIEI